MSQPTATLRRLRRFRPSIDTKFHIDHDWWENSGRDFRLYLRDQLCEECRERFADHQNTENVDWVDPDTGGAPDRRPRECLRALRQRPGIHQQRLPLASACFRVFLANNNAFSPNELNQLLPWLSGQNPAHPGRREDYLGLRPSITNALSELQTQSGGRNDQPLCYLLTKPSTQRLRCASPGSAHAWSARAARPPLLRPTRSHRR